MTAIAKLLIAFGCLSWALEGTEAQETTTHINPHLPVTIPISKEPEEQTTHHSNLYRGRPLSTIQFGGHNRRRLTRVNSTTHHSTVNHNTIHHSTPALFPNTSTSHTTDQPHQTLQPTTGWRWVYNGGRWHRIRSGTDSAIHINGSEGAYHGNAGGSGHPTSHGHHIVHVDSSETNNWNHTIHHEFNSGKIHKHYSKTSDKSGYSSPDDSSSSSSSHSGSGQSHGSSGSSGSGEHSASGSGSD